MTHAHDIFKSPDMHRRLLEKLPSGVFAAEANGSLVYVNQAFVHIMGFVSSDELIGHNLGHLFFSETDYQTFLSKLMDHGLLRNYESRNRQWDGSPIDLSMNCYVLYGERSEVVGIEGAVIDVTESRRLQKKIAVLQSAIEQTADNVMITDREGFIEYVNPAFERTTGYSLAEAVGKNPRILKSGKQPKAYYEILWSKLAGGKVFADKVTNRKKNGELYVANQIISPIVDADGVITHFVSIWTEEWGSQP